MAVVAVVEDDPTILDALTLLLESGGWTVRAYPSGETFLGELCRDVPCDCLLLDPHLPGVSGAEVARAAAARGVPILTLTARPESPVTAEVAALSGAAGVMTKPVGAAELLARIADLVRGSMHPAAD